MTKGLHDIIKETARRIRERLSLSVQEGIGKQDIHASSNQRIRSPILIFILAVYRSNFKASSDSLLRVLNLHKQFRASKVSTIQRFGTDCNGVDPACILRSVMDNSGFVDGIGFICIGPFAFQVRGSSWD
jgi:hypothetical protein